MGDPNIDILRQDKTKKNKLKKNIVKMRVVKANTKMRYTQNMYNLLREDSEGFAKLATLLAQITPNSDAQNFKSRISALIGSFSLAPNRVLDMSLDAFEAYFGIANEIYVSILDLFHQDTIAQLVGLKFVTFQKRKQQAPRSLCKVAAFLVAVRKIELDQIWAYLSPTDDKAFAMAQKKNVREMAKIARSFRVKSHVEGLPPDKKPDTHINLLTEAPLASEFAELNSKVGLLVASIDLGLWSQATRLMQMFANLGIQPAYDIRVAGALRGLLARVVKPLYYHLIQANYPPVMGEEKS